MRACLGLSLYLFIFDWHLAGALDDDDDYDGS